jgi:hypothetical protein
MAYFPLPENFEELLLLEKIYALLPELQRWLQHASATRAWANYQAAKEDITKYVGRQASEVLIGHLSPEHQTLLRTEEAYDAMIRVIASLFGE